VIRQVLDSFEAIGYSCRVNLLNAAKDYANQGNFRKGAFAAYLGVWHDDIFTFMELGRLTGFSGDINAPKLKYALWVPDLFMRATVAELEVMEKGGTFEDMIRKNMELGLIPDAYGREEEFIRERVKEHLNPQGTILRKLKDGTWSRIEEVRTPSGGIALSFIDISDLKQAEERLLREVTFRKSVVSRAAEGMCVCHEVPEFPFVQFTLWNERMIEITGFTMDEINSRGWYQALYPDPDYRQQAADRMAAMRQKLFIYGLLVSLIFSSAGFAQTLVLRTSDSVYHEYDNILKVEEDFVHYIF